MGADGPVALVTLPCPALAVRARREDGPFHLDQPDPPLLPVARAAALLRRLGLPRRGRFTLRADMAPGAGAGVSTAALLALARAAGAEDAELPGACLAMEGASDPLVHSRADALLWASRAGHVVARAAPPPVCEIVGGFWGAGELTDPHDARFPDISDLWPLWRAAAARRDLAGLARLARISALRTTRLRGPRGDPTPGLSRRLGALGWLRAHTGAARGLIFAPGAAPGRAEAALTEAGLTGALRFRGGAAA